MMKNYNEYPQNLTLSDSYYSDQNIKKSSFATLLFYWRFLKVVGYSNYQTRRKLYHRFNWVASSINVLKAIESVGVKVQVEGMKNFSGFDGPAVIVGNHMSTLETMLLPSFIQPAKRLVYVIKKELVNFPLFGPVAGARFPIVVSRTNPREDLKIVMEEGSKKLQQGISVLIFPQKTRTPYFKRDNFNSLGAKLAKRNNVPVIPLSLVTDAWANGKFIKDFGKIDNNKKVHFEFGKPMNVEGNGSAQHEEVLKFIENNFKKWGREDLLK